MYIKVENEIASNYSIKQLKNDNPNVSFPEVLSDELLAQFSVYKVHLDHMPDVNDAEQVAEQEQSPVLENGKWVLKFSVRNKTELEKNEFVLKLQSQVRAKRNKMLSETDWTALTDVTMTAEMAAYRQALRDITDHANFPYLQDSDWPETV